MKQISILCFSFFVFTGCEPMLMGPEPGNTPADNFDVLWKTIDTRYGLFPVSDLNWDSLYSVYSGQIRVSMSEDELWKVCCSLLSHLNNGHVSLNTRNCTGYYCAESAPDETYSGFNIEMIRRNYLSGSSVTGEGLIIYGRIRNTPLGYIHIRSFGGAANGRDWVRDMDQVIRELYDCEGIILDVRNNGGGFVKNNEYISALFVDREVVYYYSRQKTGPGHNDFGEPIAKTVYPRQDTLKYLKKNAILTDRGTASGSEAFALTMSNLSYSVQIGDSTLGAIGEVSHVAQLPNGWTLYYPCTLSILPDGTSPEGKGVIPDSWIQNTTADVQAGRDLVVERAIEYLQQESSHTGGKE